MSHSLIEGQTILFTILAWVKVFRIIPEFRILRLTQPQNLVLDYVVAFLIFPQF